MGVPTSEVGYTPAMPRREDHEVHKGHVVALGKERKRGGKPNYGSDVSENSGRLGCDAVDSGGTLPGTTQKGSTAVIFRDHNSASEILGTFTQRHSVTSRETTRILAQKRF